MKLATNLLALYPILINIKEFIHRIHILLADGHSTKCHNKVSKYLYWKICENFKKEINENIWDNVTEPLTANKDVNIFYNKMILRGKYIEGRAVRPEIVIWNKKEKNWTNHKVAVPNDYGLNFTERKQISQISRPSK